METAAAAAPVEMTLREAIQKRIEIVHIQPWNEYAHMLLPKVDDNGVQQGIWGHIIDPCGNLATDQPAGKRIDVLLIRLASPQPTMNPDKEMCTPWVEPTDYRARFGDPRGE